MSARGYVIVLTRPDELPTKEAVAYVRQQLPIRGGAWAMRYITSAATGGRERWDAKQAALVRTIAQAALVEEGVAV